MAHSPRRMTQEDKIAYRFTGLCLRNLQAQAARYSLAMANQKREGSPPPDESPTVLVSAILQSLPKFTPNNLRKKFVETQLLSGPASRKFFGDRNSGYCYWFPFAILVREDPRPSRLEALVPIFEAYFLLRVAGRGDKQQYGAEITNPAYALRHFWFNSDGEPRDEFSAQVVYDLVDTEIFPRLSELERRRSVRTQRNYGFPTFGVGCPISADNKGRDYLVTLPPH